MKFPLLKLTMIGTLALSLSACNANPQGMGNRDGVRPNDARQNTVRPLVNDRMNNGFMNRNNRWDNARNNNTIGLHNNTRMEMSQTIAKKIAAMDDVRSANVLLTDNNAYVAVVLEDSARMNRRTGTMGTRNTGGNRISDGMTNRTNNGYGMRGTMPRDTDNGRNRMGTNDVTIALKNRIADRIRAIKPDVMNVFVSANPDFVDRLRDLADDVNNGRPIRGMMTQFNEMAERIFPTNAGTDNTTRFAPGVRGTSGR